MTARTYTTAEADTRTSTLALNGGRCMICGTSPATNYSHRLPASAGGPVAPGNGLGLCGSGTNGCHGVVESYRTLAYVLGWLVRRGDDPCTVPALVRTPLAPDGTWHVLDENGLVRLALVHEVDPAVWPMRLDNAAIRLALSGSSSGLRAGAS